MQAGLQEVDFMPYLNEIGAKFQWVEINEKPKADRYYLVSFKFIYI